MSDTLDVLAVGYPSLDRIIRLKTPPRIGQTALITNENSDQHFFGGCAVNITCLLSSLGRRCGLVMTFGKDFESSGFRSFLQRHDLCLNRVTWNHQFKTSYSTLIISPDGEHITLFYPGPMQPHLYCDYPLKGLCTRVGLITIGELNGNRHFLEQCILQKIPIVFSMKGDFESMDQDYLSLVFENSQLIFMNAAEQLQLEDYMPLPVFSYLNSNHKLDAIVVTNGAQGSTIYQRNHTLHIPAVQGLTIRDTTGGGDAYIAGFLSEYLQEAPDYLACGIAGTALSSFIIESYGCLTQIPTSEQFEERKKKLSEEIEHVN